MEKSSEKLLPLNSNYFIYNDSIDIYAKVEPSLIIDQKFYKTAILLQ